MKLIQTKKLTLVHYYSLIFNLYLDFIISSIHGLLLSQDPIQDTSLHLGNFNFLNEGRACGRV